MAVILENNDRLVMVSTILDSPQWVDTDRYLSGYKKQGTAWDLAMSLLLASAHTVLAIHLWIHAKNPRKRCDCTHKRWFAWNLVTVNSKLEPFWWMLLNLKTIHTFKRKPSVSNQFEPTLKISLEHRTIKTLDLELPFLALELLIAFNC